MNPEDFGERLRWEMEDLKWDIKHLQEELKSELDKKAAGLRGTSYGSVWSYVKGKAPAEPRREVIQGLAKLFGVLPDYLLFGGPRTEKDVAAATLTAIATATGTVYFPENGTFQRSHSQRSGTDQTPLRVELDSLRPIYDALDITDCSGGEPWVAAIVESWRRLSSPLDRITKDMEQIGAALRGPLDGMDLVPAEMEAGELDSYILTMIPALLALVAARQRRASREAKDE